MLSMEEILRGLLLLEEANLTMNPKKEMRTKMRGLHCLEPFRVKLLEMFQCDEVEFLDVDYLYTETERKEEFYFSTDNADESEEFLLEFRYTSLEDNTEEYKYLIVKPMFSKRFGIESLMHNKSGRMCNVRKFAEGIPQLRELLNELLK